MKISIHKTKIVCTIGPSTNTQEGIEGLVRSGMDVARLNFSHASLPEHKNNIVNIHKAAIKYNKPVSILIDLPGVKMRLGEIKGGSITLRKNDLITLTTRNVTGTSELVPVGFNGLPKYVTKGSVIYLSDGFIQLTVLSIKRTDVKCRVLMGGVLSSHKGINLPGADLKIDPVTAKDLQAVAFGLANGVNVFGVSFVEKAADLIKIRQFAKARGKNVFLVAKIERRKAVDNFIEIIQEADGIMVARGDLGVEIPIEEVPIIQKDLIRKANLLSCPVITATQMLGSMTQNIRPTRAEANDVANAILDGTDAVMLSEETAAGQFPQEAVKTMVRIALVTEHEYHRINAHNDIRSYLRFNESKVHLDTTDVISLDAVGAATRLNAKCILSQTYSGSTARHISRFKPNCWIFAFSSNKNICDFLNFSYGVYPTFMNKISSNRPEQLLKYLKSKRVVSPKDTVIMTQRRFSKNPGETDSMAILTVD